MTSSTQKSDQVNIRLPEGLRSAIKRAAASNYRSMNSEIVACLDRQYGTENEKSGAPA